MNSNFASQLTKSGRRDLIWMQEWGDGGRILLPLPLLFGCNTSRKSIYGLLTWVLLFNSIGRQTPNMYSLLLAAACVGLLAGCGQSSAPVQPSGNVDELSKRIAVLEKRPVSFTEVPKGNAELSYRLILLEDQFTMLSNRVQMDEFKVSAKDQAFRYVSIDTESKGFGKVETGLGTLFVSTEKVESYLDGYKIRLNVGNPSFVTFSDMKLITSWGPTWTNGSDFDKWSSAQKLKTNDLVVTLNPGAWNAVDIVLAPATAEELRNAQVAIDLDKINLRKPAASSP